MVQFQYSYSVVFEMPKVEWLPPPCTTKQLGYIEFLRKQAGMGHKDMETVARQAIGRELDNWLANMTQSEASRVITCLKVLVKLKGGRVDGSGWSSETCTKEQRQYIERLRMDRGMPYRKLIEHFNVTDIGQLTKADASEAIGWLKR